MKKEKTVIYYTIEAEELKRKFGIVEGEIENISCSPDTKIVKLRVKE